MERFRALSNRLRQFELESDQLDIREHACPMYLQDIDKIVDVSAMLKP